MIVRGPLATEVLATAGLTVPAGSATRRLYTPQV